MFDKEIVKFCLVQLRKKDSIPDEDKDKIAKFVIALLPCAYNLENSDLIRCLHLCAMRYCKSWEECCLLAENLWREEVEEYHSCLIALEVVSHSASVLEKRNSFTTKLADIMHSESNSAIKKFSDNMHFEKIVNMEKILLVLARCGCDISELKRLCLNCGPDLTKSMIKEVEETLSKEKVKSKL